jgi:hypothetical protein
MGLTLHYKLAAPELPAKEVRQLIERLRKYALELPFDRVLEVTELKEEACGPECREGLDEYAWLKIQTTRFGTEAKDGLIYSTSETHPRQIVAFTVLPGKGAEAANFGLCRYPGEKGWSWSSFCKTQYASDPAAGGVANFLQCHVGLVCLLDKAREMEILGEVIDEGGYWEKRDVEALVREVGRWNQALAGFYGQFRDTMEAAGGDPQGIKAAIAKFSNFERLEAKSRKRMPNEG